MKRQTAPKTTEQRREILLDDIARLLTGPTSGEKARELAEKMVPVGSEYKISIAMRDIAIRYTES